MDLTRVSLAVDNENAGRANHEVIDVSVGASNPSVVKDDDVVLVELSERLGDLALANRATLPGLRRLRILRRK